MGEQYNIAGGEQIEYKGYFNLKDLYYFIDSFFRGKGYDKWIEREIEKQEGETKIIDTSLKMIKKLSDYVKVCMEIRIIASIKKNEEIMVGNEKRIMDFGEVTIIFDNIYVETDYEGRWNKTPWMYVYRWFIDRFIEKRYNEAYISIATNDFNELKEDIKSFLNMKK